MTKHFHFYLHQNTLACIDWVNVYFWQKKMKWKIDLIKLFQYLVSYEEIETPVFFCGTEENKQSVDFLQQVQSIGYKLITKQVKDLGTRKKCDFDIEIALQCFRNLEKYKTFLFFSGDGDFAPLYEFLIEHGKKVIVVFSHGALGKEVWAMNKRITLISVKHLCEFIKKSPPK